MAAGPDALYEAAEELLAAAAAALTNAPVQCPICGGGPTNYQAIWPGEPVFDCPETLAVHAGGVAVADTLPLQPPLQPMQRIVTTGIVDLAALTITVTRCVPVIEQEQQSLLLPRQELVNASAKVIYGDLWRIWNYLVWAHREGLLFQRPSGRREFLFEPAIPVRTSGGVGGWIIPVRFQLDGYRPPEVPSP